ncbi:DUF5694 domain-containing protein [Halomarina oriensis]|uniref:TraB/GumN family protein n=1 Tax=Halomarina oriensis TaxID=671145 RepID=A0A6B0GUD9_9EURY|nr:DUF5694 domain-containing protein [Halomarina oriensis]MWG35338.1 hypothetical protein [Halomarina oriensis]
MTDDGRDGGPPEGWPTPTPGQIRVLLLGTYHMDNPEMDATTFDADDVLSARRQADLRELGGHLVGWSPDLVAVERPSEHRETLVEQYEQYRSGERRYDREERFESTDPQREDDTTECRNEVVQVGFRLADRLDHDRVAPVDHTLSLDGEALTSPEERDPVPPKKGDYTLPDFQAHVDAEAELLRESTIPEFLAYKNGSEALRLNHDGMFEWFLRGEGEEFDGPELLTDWYERNVRTVHNLWTAVDEDTERVVLPIGSGHVRVLRHLLDEAPMFCPVSPLSLLPEPTGRN